MFKAVVEYFDEEERCPLVPKRMLLVFKKIVGNNSYNNKNNNNTDNYKNSDNIYNSDDNNNNDDKKQMVFVGVYVRLQATLRAVSKNFKLPGMCKYVGYTEQLAVADPGERCPPLIFRPNRGPKGQKKLF